jgi:CDGSH-type Zn-finger protein
MINDKSEARVVVSQDGPYIVTGNVPLSRQTIVADANGASVAWQESAGFPQTAKYALCRCGQSNKKPFCDGTHAKFGFDGHETASREPYLEQAKEIDGPKLLLTDQENLCAFARFCDSNGSVWVEVSSTDDAGVRATFLRQVGNCPSGRLVAWDGSTERPVEHKLTTSIGLVEDPKEDCSGPIWLRGEITLVSADGSAYETRNRVTVCRCGQSANKPFCDGTHAKVKFHSNV